MAGWSTDNYNCIICAGIYSDTACFLYGFYSELVSCFCAESCFSIFILNLVSVSYYTIFSSCEKTGIFVISFFCTEERFAVAVKKDIDRTVIIGCNTDSGWEGCSIRSCGKSCVGNI